MNRRNFIGLASVAVAGVLLESRFASMLAETPPQTLQVTLVDELSWLNKAISDTWCGGGYSLLRPGFTRLRVEEA